MRLDGRAENLEDFLASHKPGQWFTWSDTTNKTYANIVVLDGSKKPTEAKCTAGLKALQDENTLDDVKTFNNIGMFELTKMIKEEIY